jgi:hypothetical protein
VEGCDVKTALYNSDGVPCSGFNSAIKEWLACERSVREHKTPKAFNGVRDKYCAAVATARQLGLSNRNAHRTALAGLTDLFLGHDLAAELRERLSPETVNPAGFRTTLSQGVAKNVGENFVNVIVYALASLLAEREDILVDKGMPRALRRALSLKRTVPLKTGDKTLDIKIECDAAVFSREDCLNAIVISAKTRLKEVFHIGTMWKMLFDTLGDEDRLRKWELTRNGNDDVSKVLYVFATADMVAKGGRKTQGGDVERPEPRNLIMVDASFFDYVFVSKTGIPHVENQITLGTRGALFHELGCLLDLIEQKFAINFT